MWDPKWCHLWICVFDTCGKDELDEDCLGAAGGGGGGGGG